MIRALRDLAPRARVRIAAMLVAFVIVLPACTTVPATGERAFTPFMSPEQERRVGEQEHQNVIDEFGVYDDPEIQRYVASIGQLLAATSEMPDLDWTVTVLDSEIVNAFALPGGYVYVTRGLMALAENEAQLAGVLGHEIGHVTARHPAQRYTSGVLTQVGVLAAGILGGSVLGTPAAGDVAGIVGQAYMASYSREQEYEADDLGIRYLARAGYAPEAMSEFLAKMEAEKELLARMRNQTPRGSSWFDTHPQTPQRVARAAGVAGQYQVRDPMRARDVYLDKIDGMLYGDSPEQGYVRDTLFAHPELGFRFEVPADFYLVNSPQRVTGYGPDDSMIVFDGASQRGGSARDYLTRVWARGIDLRDVERIDVNGMEAATGSARGTLRGGGTVDIRLVAIRWRDDTIYRFTFISPSNRTAARQEDFRRTTHSFRPLTDAERRDLRPLRLRIHTVQQGETVEGLARRMAGANFRLERFMVLNGLRQGDRLQPGQRVKLVAEG